MTTANVPDLEAAAPAAVTPPAPGRVLAALREFVSSRVHNPAYRLILRACRHQSRWVALTLVCTFTSALLEGGTFAVIGVALEVMTKEALPEDGLLGRIAQGFAAVLPSQSPGVLFAALIAAAVGMQVVKGLLNFSASVSGGILGSRVQAEVQQTVYDRVLSFDFACASRYKVGDLVDYVVSPSPAVSNLVNDATGLSVLLLTMAAYCALLLTISVPLFLGAAVLFGLITLVQRRIVGRVGQHSVRLYTIGAELSKRIVESIQALRVLHTFHRQREAAAGAAAEIRGILDASRHIFTLIALVGPLAESVTVVAVGGFLILSYFVLGGPGQLLVFIGVLNRLSGRVSSINSLLASIARGFGVLGRLGEVLRDDDKQFSRVGGRDFPGVRETVRFEEVTLCYPGRTEPAVRGLTLTLPRGTVTALVGSSGAGKSTVSDLLLQLYEPTAGRVLADGVPIREFALAGWRSRIGVVSQDTFLFNASIRDNIRFGRPEATDEEVEVAARMAHADEFIEQLPERYATVIGERGFRLSGGQRQRLALARVILRQPELLILDEATSALDSHSERLVQDALAQFQADRTVLVVAHRLSTVAHADQILVLEAGRLVERGTHEELLRGGGRYVQFWNLQATPNGPGSAPAVSIGDRDDALAVPLGPSFG